MDPALTLLRSLLDLHADEIIDDGTTWVRAESHADLSSRPYSETRHLVAQYLNFYRAHIFADDTGPREAFIDVVTSNRSNLKFSVSTLLRGLTRRFGADLLIPAAVQAQLPPTLQADTRQLGEYLVPGKKLAVAVFEVFAGEAQALRVTKRTSREAVTAAVASMSAGDFTAAAAALTALAAACPNDQVLPALLDECRRREGRA